MASWQKQIGTVAIAISVLAGAWMVLAVGLGEVYNVVISPDQISGETNLGFGGTNNPNGTVLVNGVDFIDRIAVLTVALTVLGSAGFGVITVGGGNPPFLNTTIRYLPIIVGFVALTSFSTEVSELIQGNRTWSLYGDIQNSYMLYLASSVVAGISSFFGNSMKR